MTKIFNWEPFWRVYEIASGFKAVYRKNFEEEVEAAKKDLIELFGETKIEAEIKIELTDIEIINIIRSYLDGLEARALKKDFPEEKIKHMVLNMTNFLQHYISQEDLIMGYVQKNSPAVKKIKEVQPGTKIAKILKTFLKQQAGEELEEKCINFLVSELSLLRDQLKYTEEPVKIVISVEPLDFLLMSDATTGWKTCQSVIYGGTHSSGTLSYMFDHHTAVAYAYRTKGKVFGIEVPKKIWRQLVYIHVQDAIALFQKQYPGEKTAFEKKVRDMVGNALKKYHSCEKRWTARIWQEEELPYFHNEAGLAYTDRTETYIYFPGISPSDREDWYMTVGEIPICPVCGGEIDVESGLACGSCQGLTKCFNCGQWIPEDEANRGPDHNEYCDKCFMEYFTNCIYCGDPIYKEDAHYTPDGDPVCEACFDTHLAVCSHCGKTIWPDEAEYYLDTPFCDECFLKLFARCESCEGTYPKRDLLKDINGKYVCRDCAESAYVTCEKCGKLVAEEEACYIDDNYFLCAHCYKKHKKAAV